MSETKPFEMTRPQFLWTGVVLGFVMGVCAASLIWELITQV